MYDFEQNNILNNNTIPHLSQHGRTVTRAGIRHGSMMYMGFGKPFEEITIIRPTLRCPV